MDLALAVVPSVGFAVVGGLVGLRMVLEFKAKKLEHAPIAQLEAKMNELESRILSAAMRR